MKTAYFTILRDLLLLLPRLLGTGFRVFVGQLFLKPPKRLRKFERIDWLAGQLGLDPEEIESARIEPVHSGTADRSRLTIRYVRKLTPAPGPESLFIKSRPSDLGSALFGALFNLGGNEVSFYRHIRPDLPVKAPGVYYCEGDSSNYVMLLEDLADEDCSFCDLTSRCSFEDATRIITTLAQLHARFWQSERFETDLAWVKRLETNRDFRLLNLVRQLSVPIAYRKFEQVFPEPIRAAIPRLMNNYHRLEERWAEEPRTLLHGDAHLGNMYFQNGQAGLLDWQVNQLGQGMRDVGYFLVNSLPEETRLAHQEELIRHYLATLGDLGISLDFDTAWRQYRLQSVYAWIAGVVTAPSKFQSEAVVISGLRRSCRAIVDLDALALVREL